MILCASQLRFAEIASAVLKADAAALRAGRRGGDRLVCDQV